MIKLFLIYLNMKIFEESIYKFDFLFKKYLFIKYKYYEITN